MVCWVVEWISSQLMMVGYSLRYSSFTQQLNLFYQSISIPSISGMEWLNQSRNEEGEIDWELNCGVHSEINEIQI